MATRELWREGDKPRGYALEGALPKACVQSILSSCQPYTTCVKSMQSSLQLQAHLGLPFLEVHVVITKQHVPTSNVLFLPTAVVIHSALFVPSACILLLSREMCPILYLQLQLMTPSAIAGVIHPALFIPAALCHHQPAVHHRHWN